MNIASDKLENSQWQTSRYLLELSEPKVMGIVNITPDSFSDGGKYVDSKNAISRCEALIAQGVDILDIGAESTRPGAVPLCVEDELERLFPVVREAVKLGIPISIDTYKPEVMQAMLDIGVDIINDVYALRIPGTVDVVAKHPTCGICLMHMHRNPLDMQNFPVDSNIVSVVEAFMKDRMHVLYENGIQTNRLILDAGIGFGKKLEQNFELMAFQSYLSQKFQRPWLAGWSRKSSLGIVTGQKSPELRVTASVAAALLSVDRGARLVRVHDVRETVEALSVWLAEQRAKRCYSMGNV
jgi:dihydropteroate synthase